MRFFLGLLAGAVLTVVGLAGTAAYMRSPAAQVKRCLALYAPGFDEMSKDENIQAMMKEEGFATIEDAVRSRCEYWVKNGQNF